TKQMNYVMKKGREEIRSGAKQLQSTEGLFEYIVSDIHNAYNEAVHSFTLAEKIGVEMAGIQQSIMTMKNIANENGNGIEDISIASKNQLETIEKYNDITIELKGLANLLIHQVEEVQMDIQK